jgi:hypothetical protein
MRLYLLFLGLLAQAAQAHGIAPAAEANDYVRAYRLVATAPDRPTRSMPHGAGSRN